MKKLLLFVCAISLLLPVISFAFFDLNLKYGSRGDAVIELQDFLQDQEFYKGSIDGRFGLGTRRAVIAFQTANGLVGDGYFGRLSREKANSILATTLKPSEDAEKAETGAIASTVPTMAIITDSLKPNIYLKRMTNYWYGFSRFDRKDNTYNGTLGLWLSAVFEDPEPSSGMSRIEYYLDDVLIAASDNPSTKYCGEYCILPWDTTKHSNGQHTLKINVYDKAGNIGTESISMTIKN